MTKENEIQYKCKTVAERKKNERERDTLRMSNNNNSDDDDDHGGSNTSIRLQNNYITFSITSQSLQWPNRSNLNAI